MAKSVFTIEVRGFGSGETDFSNRIAGLPAGVVEPLGQLVDGVYEASSDPQGAKFMGIAVVGHSDRQDFCQV